MNPKHPFFGQKFLGTIDYSKSPLAMLVQGQFNKVDAHIRDICTQAGDAPTSGIVHVEYEIVAPERMVTTAQAREHVTHASLLTGGFEHCCNLSSVLKSRPDVLQKITGSVEIISLEVFDEDSRGSKSVLQMGIYNGSTSLSIETEGGNDSSMWGPSKTFIGYRVVRRVGASIAMALDVAIGRAGN